MKRKLDKFAVIDLECTCWEYQYEIPSNEVQEIIEVGIAIIDIADKSITKESFLVKPQFSRVTKFCTELTGLTFAELAKQKTFLHVMHDINAKYPFLGNIPWGSYGQFDKNMLDKQYSYLSGVSGRIDLSDRYLNIKLFHALKHGLTKEVGMIQALENCGTSHTGTHHRGHDDAENIAKILMIDMGWWK